MVFRPIPREQLIRKDDQVQTKPQPKNFLIQTANKPSAKAKRLLHVLGVGDAIGGITFVAALTSTQVERLRKQPWIGAVNEEQIMHTMSHGTQVVRGDTPPPTWGVYTHKKPTKAQSDILWLLGADVADLSVRAFELELTPVQVERLQALKWVKQVAPSVQFHTCTPMEVAASAPIEPDYSKIDAPLAGALQNRQDPNSRTIGLFVHTFSVPNDEQSTLLAELGVNGAKRKTTIFTATLSQNDIAQLSVQSWVKALRASNQARPS